MGSGVKHVLQSQNLPGTLLAMSFIHPKCGGSFINGFWKDIPKLLPTGNLVALYKCVLGTHLHPIFDTTG